MTDLAEEYGKGLYDLTEEEHVSEDVLAQLRVLRGLFRDQPDFIRLLCNMSLAKEERTAILDGALRGQVHPYVLNFLKILCERGALHEFEGCVSAFTALYNQAHGIVEASVTTGVPLEAEQRTRLIDKLSAMTGKRIVLSEKVDPGVVGGVLLEMNGKRYDNTLRRRLEAIHAALTAEAGLSGVEWGGDVHVPPGDREAARRASQLTHRAGLEVLSYGSYYRCQPGEDFTPVLESALALGAPLIRVWAGTKPWEEASPQEWEALAAQLGQAVDQAAAAGLALGLEYHRGTATQTKEGARALLEAVGRPGLTTYWQPNPDISQEEQLAEIDALLPWISTVHVFTWTGANVRHPLEAGAARWEEYLTHLAPAQKERCLLLEFVQEDSEEAFRRDARTLRAWASRFSK